MRVCITAASTAAAAFTSAADFTGVDGLAEADGFAKVEGFAGGVRVAAGAFAEFPAGAVVFLVVDMVRDKLPLHR